jgi:hypothetical protein
VTPTSVAALAGGGHAAFPAQPRRGAIDVQVFSCRCQAGSRAADQETKRQGGQYLRGRGGLSHRPRNHAVPTEPSGGSVFGWCCGPPRQIFAGQHLFCGFCRRRMECRARGPGWLMASWRLAAKPAL